MHGVPGPRKSRMTRQGGILCFNNRGRERRLNERPGRTGPFLIDAHGALVRDDGVDGVHEAAVGEVEACGRLVAYSRNQITLSCSPLWGSAEMCVPRQTAGHSAECPRFTREFQCKIIERAARGALY